MIFFIGNNPDLEKVLKFHGKKTKNNNEKIENENEKNENKVESNEAFFKSILSYQPISRIWPENGILALSIKDVRLLTEHYSNMNTQEKEGCKEKEEKEDKEGREGRERKVEYNKNINNNTNNSNNNDNKNNNDDNNNDISYKNNNNIKKKLLWPIKSSTSPLWDDKNRQNSTNSFRKNHEFNANLHKLRQESNKILQKKDDSEFFTNYQIDIKNKNENNENNQNVNKLNVNVNKNISKIYDIDENVIPILLVRKNLKNFSSRRMKNKKHLPSLGFDIIVPSVWGRAVWNAFQFAG